MIVSGGEDGDAGLGGFEGDVLGDFAGNEGLGSGFFGGSPFAGGGASDNGDFFDGAAFFGSPELGAAA